MSIPNILSIVRIALVPIFCVLFFTPGMRLVSLIILLLSGASDLLDGFIARRYHQATELGKVLDPIADKLFQFSTMLCFAVDGIVPKWFLIFMVCYALFMLIGYAAFYTKTKGVIAARWYGKLASMLIFSAFVSAFFLKGEWQIVVHMLFCCAFAVMVFAAGNYTLCALRTYRKKMEQPSLKGEE